MPSGSLADAAILKHVCRVAKSFHFAWQGLRYLLRTQPNFWVHCLAAAAVLLLAAWLRLPTAEVALLVLAIGLVLACEAFNTALEAVVDLASPSYQDLARIAKDAAAAAVLLAAGAAAAVGLLVLAPPLLRRLVG